MDSGARSVRVRLGVVLVIGAALVSSCGGTSDDDLRSAGRDLLAMSGPPGISDDGALAREGGTPLDVDGGTVFRWCTDSDCTAVVRQFGAATFDDAGHACEMLTAWVSDLGGRLEDCDSWFPEPPADGVSSNSASIEFTDPVSGRVVQVGADTQVERTDDTRSATVQPFLATDASD